MNSKGYYKSSLGMVPSDWVSYSVSKFLLEMRSGATLKPNDFINFGMCVVPKSGIIRGGKLSIRTSDICYCSESFYEKNKSRSVDNSFLLIVLRDLVPSAPNIGLIVRYDEDITYILAQGVYGLKLNDSIIDNFFLAQLWLFHKLSG